MEEQPIASDVGGRALQQFDAFAAKYSSALRGYVDDPGPAGLPVAEDLGRLGRDSDLSMLQLVGMHLEVRRAIVIERGVEHLADLDKFLSTVLDAFDSGEPPEGGPRRGTAHRGRLDWLRGLSDAYIAIASGDTLEDRVGEVCVQTKRFLDAADTRLVFGRQASSSEPMPGDEISAHLLGSAGLLSVTAQPERRWTEAERTALQQLAALISAPINDARRLESAQRAGELGVLLGGVVDPDEVLTRFFEDGVAQVGAHCALVRLLDGDGDRGSDLVSAGLVESMDEVARTGSAAFLDDPDGSAEEAWAILPLGSGITRFGVLAFGYEEAQPFDEVQRSFLADVGRRLTAALDRSRAYASERRARHEAELASERLRDLQGLASDLARAATRRRVAQVLLRRAVVSSGATAGAVAMYTTQPHVEVLAATGPFREEQWGDVGVLIESLASGCRPGGSSSSPVIDRSDLPRSAAATLAEHGIAQLVRQPVMSGEREIGVCLIGWSDNIDGRAVDRELLQAQVSLAGSTLRRAARYDVEHTIADTLQKSLLALPPITNEAVRWSVLYRAGSAGLAGGDWYDLIEIDEQRFAIVVGDIVGRGVEAAASMGQLRSATRALASRIDAPADLMSALDQYASKTGQGRFSSLAFLLLDTASGMLTYSVAGHPPPIVRSRDGDTTALTDGRGPLLGAPCVRHDAAHAIQPGTVIVVYTDGLVERRGETVDVGIERLATTLAASADDAVPDERCRDLIAQLVDARPPSDDESDDVAIVVVELLAN